MITSRMAAVLAATFVASVSAEAAPKSATPGTDVATQPGVVAQSNPISGIGIVIKRVPGGGSAKRTVSGNDGSFSFQGLQPGSYEVIVAGQAPVAVTVGPDGQVSGVATVQGVRWSRVKNQNSLSL